MAKVSEVEHIQRVIGRLKEAMYQANEAKKKLMGGSVPASHVAAFTIEDMLLEERGLKHGREWRGDGCKANSEYFQWAYTRTSDGAEIEIHCPTFLRGPLGFSVSPTGMGISY